MDELASARAVAKEWLAGATALFGLFSLGGVVFAGDAIADLDDWRLSVFAVSAGAAVLAAATSIGYGTKAAHGWPSKPRKRFLLIGADVPGSPGPDADSGKKLIAARRDLKTAVLSAGAALIFLVLGVATLWYDQATEERAPSTVRVSDEDGIALVCGAFQRVDEDGFVVRDAEGKDVVIPLADAVKVTGGTCS